MSQPPIPPEPFDPSPNSPPPDPVYGNAAYEPGYASARVPSPPPYNQGPAEPYTAPPAHKRKMSGLAITLITLGVLLVLCLGGVFAACAATTNSAANSINGAVASQEAEAAAKVGDVKLTECKPRTDEITGPQVHVILVVKNSGSEARDYAVQLEYLDAKKVRIDTDTAFIEKVAPGTTARYDEPTFLDEGTKAASCRIVGVS